MGPVNERVRNGWSTLSFNFQLDVPKSYNGVEIVNITRAEVKESSGAYRASCDVLEGATRNEGVASEGATYPSLFSCTTLGVSCVKIG